MTRLLVSVRSANEAREALAGGCDLLDAKEPSAGALGPVSPTVLGEILAVAGNCPVSAALGEMQPEGALAETSARLTFVKIGLAHWVGHDWRGRLAEVRSSRLVIAAYADHERAEAPPPEEVLEMAIELRLAAFLIDTWGKDGRGLLYWLDRTRLRQLVARARRATLPIALAGSLTPEAIGSLRDLEPDWVAVRGAACDGGRDGLVSRRRVAELAAIVRADPETPVAAHKATVE